MTAPKIRCKHQLTSFGHGSTVFEKADPVRSNVDGMCVFVLYCSGVCYIFPQSAACVLE